MDILTRSFLIAGSLGGSLYVAGAVGLHTAYALDAASSNGASGKGSSLSEQTGRMGAEVDHQRGDRAREFVRNYPHKTVSTKGSGSSYSGDAGNTGGFNGPNSHPN